MSTGEKANTRRVAVITGAAQGIGRAVARVLAQRGFALALNDLRPPVETSADVRDLTSSIELIGDIADEFHRIGEIADIRQGFDRRT